MKTVATSDKEGAEGRSNRRRRETRHRLLKATYVLIAEKGLEFLVIQEITDRADVAFGSFYNYFKSKDDIISEVIEQTIDRTARMLEPVHSDERAFDQSFNLILRLFIKICQEDLVWTAFVARVITSAYKSKFGFALKLETDVLFGLEKRIFLSKDPELSVLAVSGLMLAGMFRVLSGQRDPSYPSRVAATALEILGVDQQRIKDLNAAPVPDLVLPDFFLDPDVQLS